MGKCRFNQGRSFHRIIVQESFKRSPASTDAAWDEEIERRIARFDAGESRVIPAAEVFARLSEIAPTR
jgi:hypothetical protein